METLAIKSIIYPTVFFLFAQTSYGEGNYNESVYNGEALAAAESSSGALSNTGMLVLTFVVVGLLLILAGVLVNFLRKRNNR